MNKERQKILDKVVKLLALSEGTHSAEEKDSAKNMAATLMAKYEIKETEAQPIRIFERYERKLTRCEPIRYDSMLINIASKFNGVAYVIKTMFKKPGSNVFIGRQQDVECNDYMIDIIVAQRTSMWKKYLSDYKLVYGISPKEAIKKGWMNGFALGIKSKLDELSSLKNDKIQEYGLVPVNISEVALSEYMEHNSVSTSRSRTRTYNQSGFDAGKSASVHKGVGQNNKGKFCLENN